MRCNVGFPDALDGWASCESSRVRLDVDATFESTSSTGVKGEEERDADGEASGSAERLREGEAGDAGAGAVEVAVGAMLGSQRKA